MLRDHVMSQTCNDDAIINRRFLQTSFIYENEWCIHSVTSFFLGGGDISVGLYKNGGTSVGLYKNEGVNNG